MVVIRLLGGLEDDEAALFFPSSSSSSSSTSSTDGAKHFPFEKMNNRWNCGVVLLSAEVC